MDEKFNVVIGILVMVLLFTSLLISFILTQKKKMQYIKNMEEMREKQQNQLIAAAVRSEEIERHRIAEALHDEVGAILSSAKLHLQGINSNALEQRDKIIYEKGKSLLDDGIQKVRGISHNLHSNILKEFGLNEAISHFINKLAEDTIINVTTTLDENYNTLNQENDISIYRIVQELLNNIMKYAHAKQILVSSGYEKEQLTLTIFHDGNGLTQEEFHKLSYNKEGLGLKNIQNRVIMLKGKIEFVKEAEGSRISIIIPSNTAIK